MKSIFSFFLVLLISLSALCQEAKWSTSKSEQLIRVLANDSMQGRKAGSKYEVASLEYIRSMFNSAFKKKLKEQHFEVILQENDKLECVNGYCFFNNKKKQTVVISAHYDHIGLGGVLSKAATSIEVHNGADDNASGVAAVFQFVDYYLQNECDFNLLVVFYSAHEIGLFGSQNFYPISKKKKYSPTLLHINFDMVGRFDFSKNEIRISYSPELNNCLPERFEVDSKEVKVISSPENKLEQLDTKWSYLDKLNCVNITTGIHVDYHTPSDDAEFINFEGIKVASQLAYEVAMKAAQR
jgi:Iap family predicted aminopeptidase